MKIVVVGGGAGGLLTGLLLRRDGHEVTVIERDPEGPPADDEQAWDAWTRRGVSQIRQPHGFIAGTREILASELPETSALLGDVDMFHFDLRRFAPDPDGLVDEDDRLQYDVMRRTTFERTVAVAAEHTDGIEVHRGVAVTGLISSPTTNGVPRVTGAHTATHGDLTADLVIDSGGRRTAAPKWLDQLGAPVDQWSESDGFTYHTLWYRTHDRTFPPDVAGGFGGMAPGLIALLFPGDGGVFAVAMVGLGSDKRLRRLRDAEVFTSVAGALGPLAEWVDPDVSTPVSDVLPMGAIHNRYLRFRNGSGPSVHGFVNIGDSVLSTNPSLGRGIAIALMGALELRSVLRDTDEPADIAVRYGLAQDDRIMPWLWDAVAADSGMRNAFNTAIGETNPPTPSDRTLMARAAMRDMECWRRWTAVNQALAMPASCLEDEALMAHARDIAADAAPPSFSLSRPDLESLLS